MGICTAKEIKENIRSTYTACATDSIQSARRDKVKRLADALRSKDKLVKEFQECHGLCSKSKGKPTARRKISR
jgi:hypothetical protein